MSQFSELKKAYLAKYSLPKGADEHIDVYNSRKRRILDGRIHACLDRGESIGAISREWQIPREEENKDEHYRLLTQRANYEKSCIPKTSIF